MCMVFACLIVPVCFLRDVGLLINNTYIFKLRSPTPRLWHSSKESLLGESLIYNSLMQRFLSQCVTRTD